MAGRVLVLGGTGLLGPEVCRAFLARGAEVQAFHRGSRPERLPGGVLLLRGDRRDPRDLAVLSRTAANVVVDTTGWFPETLPELLERLLGRVRLYVLISSVAVYRGDGGGLLTEESPTGPHPVWGAFGRQKRRCEEACEAAMARGLPAVILRLSHLCGGGPDGREARLAALLREGRAIAVPDDGRARLQLIAPRDVASLCVRLAEGPPPSPCYNVTSPEIWTIQEWIEDAARQIGRPPLLRFRPFTWPERDRFLYWPGDVAVDPQRLAREIGFRAQSPRPFTPEEIRHEESHPLLSRDQRQDRRDLRPAVAP